MYALTVTDMRDASNNTPNSRGTPVIMTRYFNKLDNAMAFGKEDYASRRGTNEWEWVHYMGRYTSGDLHFVMYDIREIKAED